MYGHFSQKALDVLDFVRCQRPDGSHYGTKGKCRKGSEVGPAQDNANQNEAEAPQQPAKAKLTKPPKEESPAPPKKARAPKSPVSAPKSKPNSSGISSSEDYSKLMASSAKDKEAAKAHKEARKLEKGTKNAARRQFEEAMGGRKQADEALTEITNFGSLYYAAIRGAQRKDKSVFEDPKLMKEYKGKADTIERAVRAMPKPDVDKFRGLSVSNSHLKGLIQQAEKGGSFKNDALDSWSTNLRIADQFSSERLNKEFSNSVVFRTRNKQGASIRPFSAVPSEDEVLTPSGSSYKFRGYSVIESDGRKVHVFDLEEG